MASKKISPTYIPIAKARALRRQSVRIQDINPCKLPAGKYTVSFWGTDEFGLRPSGDVE